MEAYKDIHDFALLYLNRYQNKETMEHEVEQDFGDECFSLGFEMDCGKAFEDAYPDSGVLNDPAALEKIIGQISDIMLLGSAIFSKWRYITHWSYESLLSPENRAWFILAFSRLAELASEGGRLDCLFKGKAKKMKIISYHLNYGPFPPPEEEIEQRLIISATGSVQLRGYHYGLGRGNTPGRILRFNIGREAAAEILEAAGDYFSRHCEEIFATDIGSWNMVLTNDEGRNFAFGGSLCAHFNVSGVDLSDLIRDRLAMPDLFVFDGNARPDRVERISIDYFREGKERPAGLNPDCKVSLPGTYAERLVLDRKSEMLEHVVEMELHCHVTRKYHVEQEISHILDQIDIEDFFLPASEVSAARTGEPAGRVDCEIKIEFLKGPSKVLKVPYDQSGLPSGWPELMESIRSFMSLYGEGGILNPAIYGKARRGKDEYIFVDVEFETGGKTYCYLTDDESIKIGDRVIVPIGTEGKTAIVEVVDIHYLPAEKALYPLEKIKSIIGLSHK